MGGIDTGTMMQKLQTLQDQVTQLNQMQNTTSQSQAQQAPITTYPKMPKEPQSVEDILENPNWRSELQTQFYASELGIKAKAHMDVMFSEFCENATGFKSTMLEELRKQASKNKSQPIPKKSADKTDKEE